MRFIFGSLLLALLGFSSPVALAQAEYFLNGEAVAGAGASVTSQGGFGVEANVMGGSRFGFILSFARSEAAREFRDPVEISAWSAGVQAYPGRQGVDGPLTIGLALGIGGVSEVNATTLNLGVQVARVFGEPESGILFTPNAEVALTLALSEAAASTAQVVGVGLGVGFVIAPGAVMIIEPSAAFALNREVSEIVLGGTFGLGFKL